LTDLNFSQKVTSSKKITIQQSLGSSKNIPPKAVSVRGKPSVPKVPSKAKIDKKATLKTT
jgi:hypothetical protein